MWSLAVSGTTVGMGGEFRTAGVGGATAGPVPRSNLAAIDLTTGKATDWSPGTNDTVDVLAISGSTIYAGGAFKLANGVTRHRLAAFTTAGAATPWNPGVHNGEVSALAVVGSSVYVGGTFSGTTSVSSPAVERNYAAAFQASGQGNGLGDLTAWNPNPNALGVRARRGRHDGVPRRQLHDPDPEACEPAAPVHPQPARGGQLDRHRRPDELEPERRTTPSSRSRTSARRSTRAARSRR